MSETRLTKYLKKVITEELVGGYTHRGKYKKNHDGGILWGKFREWWHGEIERYMPTHKGRRFVDVYAHCHTKKKYKRSLPTVYFEIESSKAGSHAKTNIEKKLRHAKTIGCCGMFIHIFPLSIFGKTEISYYAKIGKEEELPNFKYIQIILEDVKNKWYFDRDKVKNEFIKKTLKIFKKKLNRYRRYRI